MKTNEAGYVDIKDMLNMDSLVQSTNNMVLPESQTKDLPEPQKKKRGRPRKSESDTETVIGEVVSTSPNVLPVCQTNEPFSNSYAESMNMLRGSIMQIDSLSHDVHGEIENIRNAKTMKGKYTYLANLCDTASSLVSTKITAIREMNGITTKCHELEMKRYKEMNAAAVQNQEGDDKYIADLYNAYINTPVNAGGNPLLAMNAGNTTNNLPVMMGGIPIGMDTAMSEEQRFQEYMQNVTPEQNRMLLDGNPNIETVVVYDPNTGDKMFDVIDTSTGTPVANYPRPDRLLLDDTTIDFATGIASNTNIGQNWKVVVLGDMINRF